MKPPTKTAVPMNTKTLQRDFSQTYASAAMNKASRARKALKVVAILNDAVGDLRGLDLLEIGCSTGYGTATYARAFRSVTALDIDEAAVVHARRNNSASNVRYLLMDSQQLAFPDASFDVVACTHVYEHVPRAPRLMQEIYRVLRPGGVCFFSAGNRLSFMEPHYRLPLLSVLPKAVANCYLRILGRGRVYYENHLTYWGLRKLVAAFTLFDYTRKVARHPELFEATDVLTPNSLKHRLALLLLSAAYWLCPTYLWVLKRPE